MTLVTGVVVCQTYNIIRFALFTGKTYRHIAVLYNYAVHTSHKRRRIFLQTSWKPPLSYVLQTQSFKIPLWKPAPRDVSIYLLISQCRDLIITAIDSSIIVAATLYGFSLNDFPLQIDFYRVHRDPSRCGGDKL